MHYLNLKHTAAVLLSASVLGSTGLYAEQTEHEINRYINAPIDFTYLNGTGERIYYQVIDGLAIYEGDIILGTHEEVQQYGVPSFEVSPWTEIDDVGEDGEAVNEFSAPTKNKRSLWPNGVLYYQIDSNYPSQGRSKIEAALKYVASKTNVKFVKRTNQSNYVKVINGSGCWSYVGMTGRQQQLSLSYPGCVYQGIIAHEFLHALGFYHEQSRADRDNYVTIHWNNIQSGMEGNFRKADTDLKVGPYDYYSVMHYSAYAFSKNRRPTITPKDPNVPADKLGNRSGLSDKDVVGVNYLYPDGDPGPGPGKDPKIQLKYKKAEIKKGQTYDLPLEIIDDDYDKLSIVTNSNNQALLPDSNLELKKGSQKGSYILHMKPLATATGTAVVTITVFDFDGGVAEAKFTLIVKDDGSSKLSVSFSKGSAEIPKNQTYSASFMVKGAEPSDLTFVPNSDNQALLPDSNLVIKKTQVPSKFLLEMKPLKDAVGKANVKLSVFSTSGGTAEDRFTLVVKDDGSQKPYKLLVSKLGACVTVTKNRLENAQYAVKPNYCQGKDNQLWNKDSAGRIMPKSHPNHCLQVSKAANGAISFVAPCKDSKLNIWQVDKEIIRSAANKEQVLDFYVRQLKIGLWKYHGGNNQRWLWITKENLSELRLLLKAR
ncbi:M12 family metallopeptidase [Spartinivicinus poritis]|uniref:M12 family metallopeptidase n=1 Tax=Spartinivicinus poritis TaxID=2994640 RepID=A0ABT5UB79_9GAMM|nr:M12 family metallopeptidase [Spartinivicinus sp. A2-2]MDE1463641.1 M12 family metallopeptidase [Spartinivicinus sp. A2-2]